MVVASLVVALITLCFAFLIHSETRETLSRINALTDTLPGAYDVNRLIRDIEKTGEFRGKVVCDAPKNTHIAWAMPPTEIPQWKRIKNRFWRLIRNAANHWSDEIYDSLVEARGTIEDSEVKRWKITSGYITSSQVYKLLTEGWEPFSMTTDNKIWLRKIEVIKQEKVNS